jgi:hypothetical protein
MQSPAASPEQASVVRQRYEPLWNAIAASFALTAAKAAQAEGESK